MRKLRPGARLVLAMMGAALLLALVPTAALAKGPTAARIELGGQAGDGPRGPITLRGDGEAGNGSDFGTLVDRTGLFPAVFAQDPDPMHDTSPTPAALLGPRSRITWTIPDGDGAPSLIQQDVYPYAAGGPLTYVRPGQRIFDGTTRGGWFLAPDALRTQLIALGLPDRPPLTRPAAQAAPAAQPQGATRAPARASGSGLGAWPIAGAAALLVVLVGAVTVARRRRPGAAPAAR